MTKTIKTYNPFFQVVREPMFTEFDGKKIRGSKDALINPELNMIVGEVGKNYKVVENKDVAEVFDQAFEGIKVHSVTDHLNGSTGKWCRQVILDDSDYTFNINGKDECKVMVEIFNGYTGQKSVGFNIKAFRLVCSNGLMGWRKELSVSIPHIKEGIVDQIRDELHDKIDVLWNKTQVWEAWSDEHFGQDEFNLFINTRQSLSDKQKEKFKDMYIPIKNEFNEDDTRWGAYNILTAIATHYTEARNGSNLFSNAYKRVEKLVDELETFNPEDHKQEETAVAVA